MTVVSCVWLTRSKQDISACTELVLADSLSVIICKPDTCALYIFNCFTVSHLHAVLYFEIMCSVLGTPHVSAAVPEQPPNQILFLTNLPDETNEMMLSMLFNQ